MSKFLIAAIQVDTQDNKKENLAKLGRFIDEAAGRGAKMVAIPENAHYIGTKEGTFENAETIPGPMSDFFCKKAKEHGYGSTAAVSASNTQREEALQHLPDDQPQEMRPDTRRSTFTT